MGSRSRGGKAIILVATVALLALAIGLAAPASAVPFKDAAFSGYATGNVLYTGALSTGEGADEIKLVNVTEAFTGASVDSKGLKAIHNEMNRLVVPASALKSFGRGSGVELGVEKGPDEPNDLALQIAQADAPPSEAVVEDLLGPLAGGPLLYASALRGEAAANWDNDTCVIGQDISNGLGHAADVQLLDTGTAPEGQEKLEAPLLATDADPADPERAVAWSKSRTYLTPQTGPNKIPGRWGLASEVRMTIAPITIGDTLTIEFLGEWVLTVTAGGVNGSSSVHYGPGDVSPSTPVLRVIQDNEILGELTTQEIPILGETGLIIPIPGVAEIALGEDPRAIGGDADSEETVTATDASAALDVVRVKLLDGTLADIRLGHMEAKAHVPAGGIDCGIPVFKSASPRGVTVNQNFVVTIRIENPYGCDLTNVKVTDVITTEGDAKFSVVDTNPNADTVPAGQNLDSGTIVWNDVGPIAKGGSKSITATIKAQGGGGIIKDIADVSATAANCEGSGDGEQLVGKSLPLRVPVVLKLKLPPTGVGTSTATMLGALALLSLAGVGIRQLRRSH